MITSTSAQSRWDVLRSREALCVFAWILATFVLAALAYKRLFPGELSNPDAMDFAQIARNIAAGHGFSTGILRPLALSGFVTAVNGVTPDISHPPLYPFLVALIFAVHGGHGGAVVVVALDLILFALSVGGVYLLARTLLPVEGIRPALLAAGLYLLAGTALNLAVSGLPVTLTTLFVTGLLIALHRAHEIPGRPAPPVSELIVGALLGFCFLAQYNLLILTVPTLLYVYASRTHARAWRGVGLCAVGFFLVTGAWLIRMANVTGNPFFNLRAYDLMADTPDYPGQTSIYRGLQPAESLFAFFFAHLPVMFAKAGRNLGYYQFHLPEAFNFWTLAGATASLLWRFGDIRLSMVRVYVALCLVLLVGVSVFFMPSVEILAPFAPALTVLAVAFTLQVMRRQGWQPLAQRVTLWVWGGLAACGTLAFFCSPAPSLNPVQQGISMVALPPLAQPLGDTVLRRIRAGVVMTDTPWELTWRTGLPALWLPRDNQTYEAVVARNHEDAKLDAPALLLTPSIAAYSDTSHEGDAWLAFSAHPQAWQELQQALTNADRLPEQFQARADLLRKMIAAHDPRVTISTDALAQQYAEAQQTMPVRISQARQQARQAFVDNYGPISEIVQDYAPAAVQSEADHIHSTFLVRRDILGRSTP